MILIRRRPTSIPAASPPRPVPSAGIRWSIDAVGMHGVVGRRAEDAAAARGGGNGHVGDCCHDALVERPPQPATGRPRRRPPVVRRCRRHAWASSGGGRKPPRPVGAAEMAMVDQALIIAVVPCKHTQIRWV